MQKVLRVDIHAETEENVSRDGTPKKEPTKIAGD